MSLTESPQSSGDYDDEDSDLEAPAGIEALRKAKQDVITSLTQDISDPSQQEIALDEPSGCYTAVEMNKDNAVLIAATATPSAAQLAQLWWRGFAKLQDTELESSESLAAAWNQSRQYFQTVHAAPAESASDEQVAVLAVHRLTRALAIIPVDLHNEALSGSANVSQSVGRISDIIKVIQVTLKFKIGAIAWVCLGQAVLVCTRSKMKSPMQIVLSHLADIVTLIARYNVMESMYQQWPNMSLEKNYEDSLVDLCAHVLRYLSHVITIATLERAEGAEQRLNESMKRIEEADDRCRGFKVTIIEASVQRGTKRSVQDVEDDDSDDSNDNEIGVEVEREKSGSCKRLYLGEGNISYRAL
ncbi:hypothetical protein BP5796_04269 [Coleophoma crateriformis]|uniref:Uncharacterized protein n=1 Tax=Coleophoma crateriformis TaxID=565419 RepID=A0A3D8SIE1_9HELO|nr:hypothetical protein BP5796_04269 [Coleophoma crateriformis]